MKMRIMGAVTLVVMVALGACSSETESVSTCCINGSFYDCSDSDKSCVEAGNTCDGDPSRDPECD